MSTRTPKQVLEYLKQLKEKLTPDLQKKVGNVLFGDNKYISKLQGVKIPKGFDSAEINTKWEDDLLDKIGRWINISSNPVASYFAKNKSLLDTLAKEFPQVLQPPIGEMAYRGTSIKIDSLEQAFRKKKFTIVRIKGREVFHFKNLTYTPNRPAQSWTTSPKVAFKFEGIASIRDVKYVQVVYATKVNRDFIFSTELMNIIFMGKENETVRVAEAGTFEAFVDTSVILNTWKLDPEENFIHRLPSAKPYFDMMVNSYNKQVKAENKRMGEELLKFASSVDEVIALGGSDEAPPGFVVKREYTKYAKKYINSIKS